MTTDRMLLEELRKDEALQTLRALVREVVPQTQARLQAKAKAQDYLEWLRKREDGEVCKWK